MKPRHFFTPGCSSQPLDVFCAELKPGRIEVVSDVPRVCRRAILASAGKAQRHGLEAWYENHSGKKLKVGTASGLVR